MGVETDVSESESGEGSELEDFIIVRGGGRGFFEVCFLDHESCFLWFNKSYYLPKQPLASVHCLSLITAPIDPFWWGYPLLGCAR